MHIRRSRLQQLYFSFMFALLTFFCAVYWFTSPRRERRDPAHEGQTNSTTTLSPMELKFNIIRYADIVSWKGHNQSSSFEATTVLSDDNRIYFHETTGRDHLNLRQLCAVESTAKENFNRSVQIFFQSNHVNLTVGPLVSILEKYPNIFVVLIDVRDYFNDTVQYC